jgi:type I restriction enzyme S subunit
MNKVKLGDLLEIRRGTTLPSKYYSKTGLRKRLTLGNFNYPNGGFKENTSKEDIFFIGDVKPEYILKKDDIITPLTEQVHGLLGETARIPLDDVYVQSGDIGLVIPNSNKLDNKFAYYLISSPVVKKQLSAGAQQTKIRHTSPDKIKDCQVYLPDLSNQKKIGVLLNNIDHKIKINNKINDELEAMAKTIYDYWFLQFEFPNEEGKPYKSSGGKMVWNEELKREIPEGWDLCTIEDISICHDAKRIPLSNKEREQMKGAIPYYGATGIMDYVNQYIFDGDYVLIAEDGSIMNDDGSPILQRISGKTWVNNHAHILEPIDNYSCKLLMMILKDIPVVTIKTGSIQMKINQKNLNKVKIVSIPDNLKNRINRILNDIDKKILLNKKESQELTSLRDFLLPLLMNGQVGFKGDKAEG